MHPSGRQLWKKWLTCGASALLFAVVAVFFYFYRQLIYLGGNIEISVVFSQLFWKAFWLDLLGSFAFLLSYFSVTVYYSRLEIFCTDGVIW